MHLPWLLALIAGIAVVISSTVARRVEGPLAGILAAAPITPTFSVLLIGEGAGDVMVAAIPAVTLSLLATLLLLLVRHPLVASLPGVVLLLILFAPAPWSTVEWVVLAVVAASIARHLPPMRAGRGARLPMWVRFCIGAGTILVVGFVKGMWPALAGWVAMAPWLFVAATLSAGLDGGWNAAMRVLHGGLGGALGILSFVAVVWLVGPAWLALPLAWCAFALTAWLWSLQARVAGHGAPGPVPTG